VINDGTAINIINHLVDHFAQLTRQLGDNIVANGWMNVLRVSYESRVQVDFGTSIGSLGFSYLACDGCKSPIYKRFFISVFIDIPQLRSSQLKIRIVDNPLFLLHNASQCRENSLVLLSILGRVVVTFALVGFSGVEGLEASKYLKAITLSDGAAS
jgi:hypothetical protein